MSRRRSRSFCATGRSSAACASLRGREAVQIDADENVEAFRSSSIDRRRGAPRWGSSWRSSTARGDGRSTPSSSTRCSMRTPPATSRSATASRSSSTRRTLARVNTSGTHVDFMIGSPKTRSTVSPPGASACRSSVTATASEPHSGGPNLLPTRAARSGNGPRLLGRLGGSGGHNRIGATPCPLTNGALRRRSGLRHSERQARRNASAPGS